MKPLFAILAVLMLGAGSLSDALFAARPVLGDYTYHEGDAQSVLTLAAHDGRLHLTRDGAAVTNFAEGSVDPMLIWFLESVTRRMAETTGGSPFYIRNRIREAVAAAQSPTVTPFSADPNRARMGAFADLSLRFGIDGGRITRLSATAGSYSETLEAK